jgi:hypothetical protein
LLTDPGNGSRDVDYVGDVVSDQPRGGGPRDQRATSAARQSAGGPDGIVDENVPGICRLRGCPDSRYALQWVSVTVRGNLRRVEATPDFVGESRRGLSMDLDDAVELRG